MKQPELVFISGLMKGGKSALLMDMIVEASDSKYPSMLILKPATDTRDGAFVRSRARKEAYPAISVSEVDKQMVDLVINGIPNYGHVFIDEVHFFSAEFVKRIADYCYTHGVEMVVSGLTYDFKGDKFPSAEWLEGYADSVTFFTGQCDCCNEPAKKDILEVDGNLVTDGESVQVEGSDTQYLTVCNACYSGKHFL